MRNTLHALASLLLSLPLSYYITALVFAEFNYVYFAFFALSGWLGIWFISLWIVTIFQSYLFLSKPFPGAGKVQEKIRVYEQECLAKAKKQKTKTVGL